MVTGRELAKLKQEIRMLKDREEREKKHQQLRQQKHKLEQQHAFRKMGFFERGLRTLPQQVRKDLKELKRIATSPATKKKISKMEKLLANV